MSRYQVVIAARAQEQVRAIDVWWRKERPSAPDLFLDELRQAIVAISESPAAAPPYAPAERSGVPRPPTAIRRRRLSRTRYSVFYTVDDSALAVVVLAVWHSSRGAGPTL